MAIQYIDHLRPRYFMPFAGQYILGGKLVGLNKYRGILEQEEILSNFQMLLQENKLQSECVLLNSGDSFGLGMNFETRQLKLPSPEERDLYMQQVLSRKKLVYEKQTISISRNSTDFYETLKLAYARLTNAQTQFNHRSSWKVYLDVDQDELYCIPFDRSSVRRVGKGTEREPFIRITLDHRLLAMILDGRAHWDPAAIGSHLTFFRKPDIYDISIVNFLNYLRA